MKAYGNTFFGWIRLMTGYRMMVGN